MIENGSKIIRDVEPFFEQNNKNILGIVEYLNKEISEFQTTYDLINKLKDEAIKEEHWI